YTITALFPTANEDNTITVHNYNTASIAENEFCPDDLLFLQEITKKEWG
uniref:Uncharacterized protein n=1 Tax=Ciona savignyi TaxID=51511 RepID=H2Z428_CIOSA